MFLFNSKQLNVNKKTNIYIKLTCKKSPINIKTNFFLFINLNNEKIYFLFIIFFIPIYKLFSNC